jgi:hypothetical protein
MIHIVLKKYIYYIKYFYIARKIYKLVHLQLFIHQ